MCETCSKRFFVLIALAGFFLFPMRAVAQGAGIDLVKARQYFQEAQALCEKDGSKLWGVSLCSPMLLVDSQTRQLVASQADAEGKLTREGEVFVGRFQIGRAHV